MTRVSQGGSPFSGVFSGDEKPLFTLCAPISGQVSPIVVDGMPEGVVLSSPVWQTALMPVAGSITALSVDPNEGSFILAAPKGRALWLRVKSIKDVPGRNEITCSARPGACLQAGDELVTCHGDGIVVQLVLARPEDCRLGFLFHERDHVRAGRPLLEVYAATPSRDS